MVIVAVAVTPGYADEGSVAAVYSSPYRLTIGST
jgi:hypothetical protein